MAAATSLAPLWMTRKTTSRKPRNAATISEVEMTWLPVLRAVRVEDGTTIAAPNRLSAIVVQVETRGVARDPDPGRFSDF